MHDLNPLFNLLTVVVLLVKTWIDRADHKRQAKKLDDATVVVRKSDDPVEGAINAERRKDER